MDPFSATASAVALLGAGVTCARILRNLIKDFRDAPLELIAMSNEVNDLNAVLAEIEIAGLDKRSGALEGQDERASWSYSVFHSSLS
jgi:phage tail sheath gpL-like